jgi:hypothetical protein
VPSLARHEWAMRILEFVLGYGPRPTTKFQHQEGKKLERIGICLVQMETTHRCFDIKYSNSK